MASVFLVLMTAVAFVPREAIVQQVVDVIEVNHFHDEQARPVFTQMIFWNWVSWQGEYRVVDWRMLKKERASMLSHRWDRSGWWYLKWRDWKDHCWREVRAPMFRETWTQYDPEVHDRTWLEQSRRAGLLLPRGRLK